MKRIVLFIAIVTMLVLAGSPSACAASVVTGGGTGVFYDGENIFSAYVANIGIPLITIDSASGIKLKEETSYIYGKTSNSFRAVAFTDAPVWESFYITFGAGIWHIHVNDKSTIYRSFLSGIGVQMKNVNFRLSYELLERAQTNAHFLIASLNISL